jgi:two-component system, response regulator, stage 0 sporulation protein F
LEKILCLDEDLQSLRLYQKELSREGYAVILAQSGEEAIAKYSEENPDLMIMDIRMPGKKGLEILSDILQRRPDFPVILNTAYSECTANFMTWGAEACLMKSADLRELKETVRRLAEQKARKAKGAP